MPMTPSIIETTDAAASVSTTYHLDIGQTAQGNLALGDHDWYSVNLVAGHTYTIAEIGTNATTLRCEDTFLNLRNSTGTVIASNDDVDTSSGFYNSIITYTATATGTFYIDAGSYADGDPGQYGLSITEGSRASFDDDMGAGALLNANSSWSSSAGTSAVVTFGFRSTAGTGGEATFSQCTVAEMASIRGLLSLWSDVCNITFQDVNPTGYTNNATVLIGNYNNPNDGAGAYAYFPGSTASNSSDGDIWLNLGGGVDPNNIDVGGYTHMAIVHEMGHMLGLDHPGPYNAAPGVNITYANNAMFAQDSNQRTIMSYFNETDTGANFGPAYVETPMIYDILAAQQIYGVNTTTRSGNTTYGFNANTDHNDIYDASQNATLAFCVWDAGGNDTFDFSGYANNQQIDLNEASFSNVGGHVANVSIAYGVTIENAIGGTGADRITGNSAANVLTGGDGNDTIFGGGGGDTIDGGNGNDYMVGGGGTDDLTGGSGNDRYVIENATDHVHEGLTEGTADMVLAKVSYTLASGVYVETLKVYRDIANLQLTGNEFDNRVLGSTGADTLDGAAGSDKLYGGAGNDVLSGGLGNDNFYFDSALNAATNVDTISDFTNRSGNNDRIFLDDAIFSGIFNTGSSIDASLFVANAGGIATAASRIIYDTTTGALYYDQDGSGGAHARIQFASITGHTALTSADFVVY